MGNPNKYPEKEGAFIGDGGLKERGVYIKKSILGGAFIGEGSLKEGGRLLEKLRYFTSFNSLNMLLNIQSLNHLTY